MVSFPSQRTGLSMEILLIEDGLLDARLTIEALRRCAIYHRVTLFRNATDALDFLHRRGVFKQAPRPDLILLDLLLPDMLGVDFLRHIRSDEALAKIPVVVLTSSDAEAYQAECEELGIKSYIRKPFNEDKFLSVVREVKGLALALAAASAKEEPKSAAANEEGTSASSLTTLRAISASPAADSGTQGPESGEVS